MRPFSLSLIICLAACSHDRRPPAPDSQAVVAALRDTLIRLGSEDQAGRDSIGLAVAGNDTALLQRFMRADSARTRWLRAVVAKSGWPRRSVVGDTAASAAWLIVQHSPINEFQEQMLPILESEAKRGEVRAADVAMLLDRVRVHQGKPQQYGTQFELKNKRLVPNAIAEMAILDSLRKSVGLPPMAEYVKMLESVYRFPVQWPPTP